MQDHKPLLAICRGLQVLNVALGGSLYQDLPSQLPDALDHQSGDRCQSWTVLDHEMLLEPTSRLAELLGTDRLAVNSLHHQGIKQLGRGLTITGRAPDGVIEAIEMRDGGWVVAVQCHPEELWYGADRRWRNVFGAFVEAAGGLAAPLRADARERASEGRGEGRCLGVHYGIAVTDLDATVALYRDAFGIRVGARGAAGAAYGSRRLPRRRNRARVYHADVGAGGVCGFLRERGEECIIWPSRWPKPSRRCARRGPRHPADRRARPARPADQLRRVCPS